MTTIIISMLSSIFSNISIPTTDNNIAGRQNTTGATEPEDSFRDEINPILKAALQSAAPKNREAFELQLSGYNLKEIAEILYESGSLQNRNKETVKSRIYLCKKRIPEYLAARKIQRNDF